jgi:hypothetical protein
MSNLLTPEDFKPVSNDPFYFQQGVVVIGPGMGVGQVSISLVNPLYCGTSHTAEVMMQVFASLNPKLIMHPPFGEWSTPNPFQQLGMVPWLQFEGGVLENAGLLASAWTHGYPVAIVEQKTLLSIQQDIAAAAQNS